VAPTTLLVRRTATTLGTVYESRHGRYEARPPPPGQPTWHGTTVAHPRTSCGFKEGNQARGQFRHRGRDPCVTYFGRKNVNNENQRMDTGGLLLEWIKDTPFGTTRPSLSEYRLATKYIIGGVPRHEDRPRIVA